MGVTLPAWWQVAPPHHDIRTNKKLDESIFAADLAQVVRGNAPFDYQDPARFFATTYLSAGLSDLLRRVLREMAGTGSGNRIIQIDTPFGGGKTHTLLALYHLFTAPDAVRNRPELADLLRSAGLTAVPDVRVVTFVGTESSAAQAEEQADGTRVRTIWGQLAHQLGGRDGYQLVRESDEQRVAPGVAALVKLLETRPALILIDELVNYIVGAAGIPVGDATLKDQTISFLQQLTSAVAQTAKSVLLLTIPSSQTEIYGQAAQDMQQRLFASAQQVSEIAGRILTVTTPVQGDDIYEVLRRRLLDQPPDENARRDREMKARRVAEAYVRMYRAIPHDVPLDVQEEAYIERMVRAYPFHPDVVRLLYERWGTLPDFQRTRGALRILGLVLADLFVNNRADPLVLPAHINLGPGELRNELVRVVNNPAYMNVLDSDIAGKNAKAPEIDRGLGTGNARFSPALRAATTIFLWSFSGAATETKGATEANVRVGMLEPGMESAIVGHVLSEFRRRLWYLHEQNDTYRFDTQANLNLVIVQKEQNVSATTARAAVEEQVRKLATGSTYLGPHAPKDARTYLFPSESGDVADTAALGIVLLRPGMHAPAGTEIAALPPLVDQVFHYYGNKPRTHRNALVVLVPDAAQVAAADGAAKRVLALRAANSDTTLALQPNQYGELKTMLSEAEKVFPQVCGGIYRSVVIPAGMENGGMERFDLGVHPLTAGAMIWDAAFADLISNERYLTALGPMPLIGERFNLWPKGQDYVTTQQLWDAFVQFPHLPMLAGKHVLTGAIERGANDGLFGYAVGDEAGPPFATGRFGTYNATLAVEIARTSFVVTAEYAQRAIVPQTDPVREIDPRLLLDPAIWPQGSQRRTLPDIWEQVKTYFAPRPITGPEVLAAAVLEGITAKLFRATDGTDAEVPYERLVAQHGVQLMRPEKIVVETHHILTIDVRDIPTTKLGGVFQGLLNGVVKPATAHGATVTLRLLVDVHDPDGIDENMVNLTIKPTFEQLGLSPDYTLE